MLNKLGGLVVPLKYQEETAEEERYCNKQWSAEWVCINNTVISLFPEKNSINLH